MAIERDYLETINQARAKGDKEQEELATAALMAFRGFVALGMQDLPVDSKEQEPYVILPEFTKEARKAVEAASRIIFTVDDLSLQELQDKGVGERLGYVNSSPNLLKTVPPKTQIAVDPRNLAIPRSNNKTLDSQTRRVEIHSMQLQERLGRRDIAALMFPGLASVLVQADLEFQDKNKGKPLIADLKERGPFYLRTIDQTTGSFVARVGRSRPGGRLGVGAWAAGFGFSSVWAPSVVVPVEIR